jgi:hemolysin III
MLRGWSHVVGFVAMVALGSAVVAVADASAGQRWVLAVWLGGMSTMFGVSALYHRGRWRPATWRALQRLDHSAIFLAIAGTYTPVAAFCLDGWYRPAVLGTVWGASTVGIATRWMPVNLPRWLFGTIYVMVGWSMLLALPGLLRGAGGVGFGLLLAGGMAYTLGAVVFAAKRPDPWPKVFGFHEVFHACTLVGAGLHMAAIAFAVLPRL